MTSFESGLPIPSPSQIMPSADQARLLIKIADSSLNLLECLKNQSEPPTSQHTFIFDEESLSTAHIPKEIDALGLPVREAAIFVTKTPGSTSPDFSYSFLQGNLYYSLHRPAFDPDSVANIYTGAESTIARIDNVELGKFILSVLAPEKTGAYQAAHLFNPHDPEFYSPLIDGLQTKAPDHLFQAYYPLGPNGIGSIDFMEENGNLHDITLNYTTHVGELGISADGAIIGETEALVAEMTFGNKFTLEIVNHITSLETGELTRISRAPDISTLLTMQRFIATQLQQLADEIPTVHPIQDIPSGTNVVSIKR